MRTTRGLRAFTYWARRRLARRRAAVNAARGAHADAHVVDVGHRARDDGESYDTWRRAVQLPRRAGR